MANRNRDLHPNPNHNVIPILHLHNAECMKLQKNRAIYSCTTKPNHDPNRGHTRDPNPNPKGKGKHGFV